MSSRFEDTRSDAKFGHENDWPADQLHKFSPTDPRSITALSMTNDEHAEVPGQAEEIDDLAGSDRNKGPQPIIEVMRQYNLNAKDLVSASAEQLTHKMVARAMKGRQLTINSKGIVQRAMNRATSKVWTQKQLFNY